MAHGALPAADLQGPPGCVGPAAGTRAPWPAPAGVPCPSRGFVGGRALSSYPVWNTPPPEPRVAFRAGASCLDVGGVRCGNSSFTLRAIADHWALSELPMPWILIRIWGTFVHSICRTGHPYRGPVWWSGRRPDGPGLFGLCYVRHRAGELLERWAEL